jgi:uncharacterized protein involved in exopolysaccharide biosynthesis
MDSTQLLGFLFGSLRRRKISALFAFAFTLLLVLVGIALCPRTYRSEAKLFVRMGRESVTLDPTATTGQFVPVQSSREIEIRSIRDILESRVLMEKVVEKLGPEYILDPPYATAEDKMVAAANSQPTWLEDAMDITVENVRHYAALVRLSDPVPETEQAVKKLTKTLEVDGGAKSSIILLELESKSPSAAQKILQTYLDVYRELHVRVNRSQENYAFFATQTERLHDQLVLARKKMQQAKDAQGLVSIEVRKTNLQDQISGVEKEIRGVEAKLSGTKASLAASNKRLDEIPARLLTDQVSGMGDPATDTMRPQLYDLEIAAERAKGIFSEEHPERQRIMAQLASAQKIFDQQAKARPTQTSTINRSHQELELMVIENEAVEASVLAELKALEEQRDAMQITLRQLNASDVELAELQTQVDLLQASHREYAENLELSRIDEALRTEQISNVSVVQEPSLILLPVTPNKKLLFAAGSVLAMLNAVGLAAWRERKRFNAEPQHPESTAASSSSESTEISG